MTGIGLKKRPWIRIARLLLVAVIGCALLINILGLPRALADPLTNRSVSLSTNDPGKIASHSFQFFMPTTDPIGSIVFEYCTNSPIIEIPCTAPAGLDVTGANISSQTGNAGFSVDNANTTPNKLQITRVPLSASIIQTAFEFSNIVNPSNPGQVVYVRIAVYPTADGSGNYIHNGSVAFETTYVFNVNAFVPPFLGLCVGLSVAVNCSSIAGDSIDLGEMSPIRASSGQSQFSAGTNSASGYAVYALGTTMTSGNNAIPALTNPTPSFPGNGQFGINLRANTVPASGQDPSGPGTAVPNPNYDIANQYVFGAGDQIVSSGGSTDYNRMTVSYLVNINNSQPIGVYSTTLTFLAVAQF